jgi:hypothetical protein
MRDLPATATTDAHQVTVIAAIAALATATSIGYYFGRRATSPRQSWRARTSRIALGRQAISLLAIFTARQIQRRLRAERILPGVAGRYGPRVIAPLEYLRDGMVRLRSY